MASINGARQTVERLRIALPFIEALEAEIADQRDQEARRAARDKLQRQGDQLADKLAKETGYQTEEQTKLEQAETERTETRGPGAPRELSSMRQTRRSKPTTYR